jgi:hypothetical protein
MITITRGDEKTQSQTLRAAVPLISTLHGGVDAAAEATAGALERLEPLRPLAKALAALGIAEDPSASARGGARGHGRVSTLQLTLGSRGCVDLAWCVSIEADGDDGSLVSISLHGVARDTSSSGRLLEAWPLLGPLLEQQSRRLLAAIRELAEEDAFAKPVRFLEALAG